MSDNEELTAYPEGNRLVLAVALLIGFLCLLGAPAWAEPQPSASVQASPGEIVLLQYNYAPCGNDWFTRCEIRATDDGGYYEIHQGYMTTVLVESEKLSDQDWEIIKNTVMPAASLAEPQRLNTFYGGTAISVTAERNAITLPVDVLAAYEKTKPSQRYRYWSGPGRGDREKPSKSTYQK